MSALDSGLGGVLLLTANLAIRIEDERLVHPVPVMH
jgi:hypothetical protein